MFNGVASNNDLLRPELKTMIEKLIRLWYGTAGDPALVDVRSAILEQFKIAFRDLDQKETFELFCQIIGIDDTSEGIFEHIIPDYKECRCVTIRPTKNVEGPVTIMMENGDCITVPSIIEESLYFVIDSGKRTINLFIIPMAFFSGDIFGILTALEITEFVLGEPTKLDMAPNVTVAAVDEATVPAKPDASVVVLEVTAPPQSTSLPEPPPLQYSPERWT